MKLVDELSFKSSIKAFVETIALAERLQEIGVSGNVVLIS